MDTKEFLQECKKAGYEHVTIGVEDKQVPASMAIEKPGERKYSNRPSAGDYWGGVNDRSPTRVVCASPNLRDSGFPALWKICEESSLTAGCDFRGAGCNECHNINRSHQLVRGYYNLNEDLDKQIKDNQAA